MSYEEREKTSGHYSVSYQKPRWEGCNRPAVVRTRGMYLSKSSSFLILILSNDTLLSRFFSHSASTFPGFTNC
jgi:hypothetical protein